MSPTRPPARTASESFRLAAVARSIVSCPSSVDLSVAGVADVVSGEPALALRDERGVPVFSCRPGSPLATAAESGRHAVVRLVSGIGPASAPERGDRLALGGRLTVMSPQTCECCEEQRAQVALVLDDVVIRPAGGSPGRATALALEDYLSDEHTLNLGYLQRCAAHATEHHQSELRASIATSTWSRMTALGGVRIHDLTTDGVDVSWVDAAGGHHTRLTFERPATNGVDLALLLRTELKLGVC